MSDLCVCGGRRVHTVLGQQDKLVKNVCRLGMWPTPASLPPQASPQKLLTAALSSPELSGGIHGSQPTTPCYR